MTRPLLAIALLVLAGLAGHALGDFLRTERPAPPPRVGPAEVRAALLEDPTIFEEAWEVFSARFRDRQASAVPEDADVKPAPRALVDRILALPGTVTDGAADAPVTVVEFLDLNCPHCRAVARDVAALKTTEGDVRRVFVHIPILAPGSLDAARAALAIADQGLHERFILEMAARRGPADRASALAVARTVGANIERLQTAMDAPATLEALRRNIDFARGIGIDATPTFVFAPRTGDGEMIVGTPSFAEMTERTARMRAAGDAR